MDCPQRVFARIKKSPFRARFRLSDRDRLYLAEKGMEAIREHAREFVKKRLSCANPPNDGRQTPMRGHPVFLAMHACACCCRGCLEKWHGIPRGRALLPKEEEDTVSLLVAWIEMELGENLPQH